MMKMIDYFAHSGLVFEIRDGNYELKDGCPFCGKAGFAIKSEDDMAFCLSCSFVGDIFQFEAKKSGISREEAKQRLGVETVVNLTEHLDSVAEKKKQSEILKAIEMIPQGETILGSKVKAVLQLIAARPQGETEDYFRFLRNRFPDISHQQLIDFRHQVKDMKQVMRRDDAKKKVESKTDVPEDIKQEALAFLKDPAILKILQGWLSDIGIVGEQENRIALWLMFLSRKLTTQIHACVLGQSSSGKSELVKKVLSTLPEDEVIEFSSLSARALDYQGEHLNGKVIFLSEMAGISEEVEYTIRICMSEQRLQRGHVIKDEVTGQMTSVANPIEVKSVFAITTTKSKGELHNENATRMLEIYADESQRQTRRVIEHIKHIQSREFKIQEKARQRKLEVLKAAQKLLDTVDISIPYAPLLTFPDQTTRNRRDMGRFLNFLKVIAFLRQHQKEIKSDAAGKYIECDAHDYRIAYEILLPIIRNTLDDLSPRSMTVLEVCCLLQAEISLTSSARDREEFTVKDIQERAVTKGIDLRNVVNLRQEIQELTEKEYLELVSGKFGQRGSRQKFRVTAKYEIDEAGEVTQIMNRDMKMLSPEELGELLTTRITNKV